ncbi:MAG: AbrB family transcriptional regulator [Pseudomonadota bacterium]
MLKTISKIGNSQGLIFDAALLDMAGLKLGDQVNVTVAPGGSMVITPIRSAPPMAAVQNVINETMAEYKVTLKKLA